MIPYADPVLVAHCDWSKDPAKQWMAVGRIDDDGRASADAPEPVGDATTLLERLRERAGAAKIVAGFDFPIGVPHAYAQRAGIERFWDLLEQLANGQLPLLLEPAERPEDISVGRPFYPARPGGTSTRQLLDGLGVADMSSLLRRCERRTPTRRSGSSLFWLMGGAQVGKAAIAGWRSVLLPSITSSADVGLWPHDGTLKHLLDTCDVVLAETYPTEFASHLDARPGTTGKKDRAGRAPACRALEQVAAALGVRLSEAAADQLAHDFGELRTGEDRFDAFLGLIGMLNVVLGSRDPGPPPSVSEPILAVEGWILGQLDDGAEGVAPPQVTPLQRLADLLRRRNALDDEIAQIIGRPALPGHIGEFIAAEVFDIQLAESASTPGYDGVFRSGPLAGETVNVKLQTRRDGTLDIPAQVPDRLLVLAGRAVPPGSSAGTRRPMEIAEVFLFDAVGLVDRLHTRGVAVGTATSVTGGEWERARLWPEPAPGQPEVLDQEARRVLRALARGLAS
jgi:hypothetical protein